VVAEKSIAAAASASLARMNFFFDKCFFSAHMPPIIESRMKKRNHVVVISRL
jgi:hypothetical protein